VASGLAQQPIAGPGDLLAALRASFGGDPIRHVQSLPRRAGQTAEWPGWVPAALTDALAVKGISRPWAHQAHAAEIAYSGRNVVISTGTASGKSLAYQLPLLATLLGDPHACALYLSPTKALAADQLQSLNSLDLAGCRAVAYDGDTSLDARGWAQAHGRLLLTNPDMLHLGILPYHARWSRLLRNLRYVVVDECHYYRGVFGSHVALVLRRLRRLAAYYGSDPVFVLASATVADPAAVATRLVGAPVTAVTEDGAPHPGADFVLWEPSLLPAPDAPRSPNVRGSDARGLRGDSVIGSGPASSAKVDFDEDDDSFWSSGPITDALRQEALNDEGDADADTAPLRRSASAEAARIMATLAGAGARVLTFVRSRAGAEQVALTAARQLERTHPALAAKVSAYRGGYLPEDRRELERAFDSGKLVAVASTNALELGVDIAGVDATVLAGYPGTLASLWQQAGRAGRGDIPALITFVARDNPLDSYLVHHPEAIFARPVEAAVINPANPYVLGPHLACAAAEMPLTHGDLALFGGEPAAAALAELVADKVLRRRPAGYFYAGHRHPANDVSLRGSGHQIAVVEASSGRMLGTEDAARAPASIHPGAVYLHQGHTYLVRELDIDGGVALLDADRPDWWTSARSVSSVEILDTAAQRLLPGGVLLASGQVRVAEQVVGYIRRRGDGTLIDMVGLDMPEQVLTTRAVWYTIRDETLHAAGLLDADVPGALHAAEHAAIGLLPLFAGCDRWDIGGLSTALHADTGEPTVIVYDGVPGGAGFADHGFAVAHDWLRATRDAVAGCPCTSGCPSCVQSPKCGNGNNPLDKAGAVTVLGLMTDALA
jgi:DEAD/DEAH box helicase domain-containing protein